MSRRKPLLEEEYYYVNIIGDVIRTYWFGDSDDEALYNMGNCFATEEEAEEVARTWKRLLNEYHENKKLNWSSSSKLMEVCTDALKNVGGLSDTSETVKLPDWCKVGGWGWNKDGGYGKIETVRHDNNFVCLIMLDGGIEAFGPKTFSELKPARLRPYNPEEMKALVGKVIEHKKDLHLVTNYLNDTADNEPIVCVGTNWRDAKGLIEHNYTIEATPCGVLEHLEDGEWVE